MFGMVEAVKKDLAGHLKYHDFIRGMKWELAVKTLKKIGISEYQTDLIRNAFWVDYGKAGWYGSRLMLDYDSVVNDADGDIEAVRNLKKRGLVQPTTTSGKYYLTEDGQELWRALGYCYQTKNYDTSKETGVSYYLDINMSRDGLLGTCKKINWLLRNRSAVKNYRTELFLQNLQTDQKQLDNTLNMIATSEQRVARKLIEQGPLVIENYWTEEQQRAQNDLYWSTDSLSAFWLNPMGILAEPTPAPDWWSPPLDYQSKTQQLIAAQQANDVVARSLVAPPVLPKPEKSLEELLDEVITELESLGNGVDSYDDWAQSYYAKSKSKTSDDKNNGPKITSTGNLFKVVDGDDIKWFGNYRAAHNFVLAGRKRKQSLLTNKVIPKYTNSKKYYNTYTKTASTNSYMPDK